MTTAEIYQAKVEAWNLQVRAYEAEARVYASLFTTLYVNKTTLDSLIRDGKCGEAARFLLQHPELL